MPAPLGQHFLTDARALQKIARSLAVAQGETVIEIGPGAGALTEALQKEILSGGGCGLIGIERDSVLAGELSARMAGTTPPVRIITGDVRTVLPETVAYPEAAGGYSIAGNIPYYLSGTLFRQLSALNPKPRRIVLTLQKEVAERLAAKPPNMNLLAATVGRWADAEVLFSIPRTAFDPPPNVDSAVIAIVPREGPAAPDDERYYALVRALFKQPRKTIWNNLRARAEGTDVTVEMLRAALAEAKISPGDRPQTLTPEKIGFLSNILPFSGTETEM